MGGHNSAAHVEIKNPGPYLVPQKTKNIFWIFLGLGIAAFVAALVLKGADGELVKRGWSSFVMNHFYFLSLALGGLFFAALQWITGAMWSAPVRRLAESFTSYLPYLAISFGILYFGLHTLFHWTHHDIVANDPVLLGKASYLNVPFFMIRNFVVIGLWVFFARKLVGNSVKQDAGGAVAMQMTEKNRSLTPAFLLVFGLSFTMASFDMLMSLDPHWFSTMFGVYCFAGMFYSTLALLCLLTIHLQKKGPLARIVNENHLHDIGKFMFGFSIFWAYIGFSQYMLIWYANLPEETPYMIRRTVAEPWLNLSIFLLIGKFVVPFLTLMPRANKRNPKILTGVAIWMLVMHWVDMMWLVQPEFFSTPVLGWVEIGTTLGFMGAFGLVVSRFLGAHNIVAIGDPRLDESVNHHHQ